MAPPPRMSRARLLAVTKVGLDVALTTAKREQRRARTFMVVGWIGGRIAKQRRGGIDFLWSSWNAGIVRKRQRPRTRQRHRGLTSRLKSNLSEVTPQIHHPQFPKGAHHVLV